MNSNKSALEQYSITKKSLGNIPKEGILIGYYLSNLNI
jgi:hypothetical protein